MFKSEDQHVSIELVDIFGRTVYADEVIFSGKAYGFYWNEAAAGIYQLVLNYNGRVESHTLMLK